MTFTKKKIDEFESKLIAVLQDTVSCNKIEKKNIDDLKECFKQTIVEAEREGMEKMKELATKKLKELPDCLAEREQGK